MRAEGNRNQLNGPRNNLFGTAVRRGREQRQWGIFQCGIYNSGFDCVANTREGEGKGGGKAFAFRAHNENIPQTNSIFPLRKLKRFFMTFLNGERRGRWWGRGSYPPGRVFSI